MALDTTLTPWTIKGELILNCNCTVFCPCVVSLGQHPRSAYCLSWQLLLLLRNLRLKTA